MEARGGYGGREHGIPRLGEYQFTAVKAFKAQGAPQDQGGFECCKTGKLLNNLKAWKGCHATADEVSQVLKLSETLGSSTRATVA